MHIPLLDVTVHPDWQEISQQQTILKTRLWRIMQVLVILLVLILFMLPGISRALPLRGLLYVFLLFVLILWVLPLWSVLRLDERTAQTQLRALSIFLALSLVAALLWATYPFPPYGLLTRVVPDLAPYLSLLAPLTSGAILVYSVRRAPRPMRRLGLGAQRWLPNLIIGAAAGAALGFHLWLTTHSLRAGLALHVPSPGMLVWLFCYEASLRATGEELLFRGLGYHLALEDTPAPLLGPATRLTLLNVLFYLVPLSQTADPVLRIWIAAYGTALAVLTLLLRYRQQSLLPALACNVAFSLFVGWVVF